METKVGVRWSICPGIHDNDLVPQQCEREERRELRKLGIGRCSLLICLLLAAVQQGSHTQGLNQGHLGQDLAQGDECGFW